MIPRWEVHNCDCLEFMRSLADGSVDAVVTDPPYGIQRDEQAASNEGKWGWRFYGHTSWDRARPDRAIFDAILNLNVPTLIWGGNYFTDYLPPRMGWMAWDKGQRDFSLADFELAWTSENKAARCVVLSRGAAFQDGKCHPTQKPIEVMRQSIEYLQRGRAKPIRTVFDPFCGSGTTGVACVQTGRNFIGCEIDPGYAEIARRRCREAEESIGLMAPVVDAAAVQQEMTFS